MYIKLLLLVEIINFSRPSVSFLHVTNTQGDQVIFSEALSFAFHLRLVLLILLFVHDVSSSYANLCSNSVYSCLFKSILMGPRKYYSIMNFH